MIYFIRNSTKNFIEDHKHSSINGLNVELASIVEENPYARNLDDYIKNILMEENQDA